MPSRVLSAAAWKRSTMSAHALGVLPGGVDPPPDSRLPSFQSVIRVVSSVTAARSAWVIWPIFSSSVIRPSRSFTRACTERCRSRYAGWWPAREVRWAPVAEGWVAMALVAAVAASPVLATTAAAAMTAVRRRARPPGPAGVFSARTTSSRGGLAAGPGWWSWLVDPWLGGGRSAVGAHVGDRPPGAAGRGGQHDAEVADGGAAWSAYVDGGELAGAASGGDRSAPVPAVPAGVHGIAARVVTGRGAGVEHETADVPAGAEVDLQPLPESLRRPGLP